jgi:preprotein translocase subunit YajC
LGEVFMQMLPMFAIVFFVFYFMVIRPQNQKMLEREKLLNDLKKGESIVLSGGYIGKFISKEDKTITVEIAPNVRIKSLATSVIGRYDGK